MAELVLVANPHRRRRHRHRKMSALQRRYFGKGHKGHKHRRRRVAVAAAPHRRHRRSGGMRHHAPTAVHRRRHHLHHYRRRRNPSLRGFTGAIVPTFKSGAWGAAGALGLDALWGLVFPRLGTFATYLANPYVGFAAKGMGAVAVGALGGRMLRGRGRELAVGAMTVVTHDFFKSLLQQLAPTIFGAGGAVPLGAYLSGSAPIVGTATIPQSYLPYSGSRGYGAYMSGSDGQQTVPYKDDSMGEDLVWSAP